MDVPALKIVGFEGLWGAGVMLLILLPIVQLLPGKDGSGLHEDSLDTLHVRRRTSEPPTRLLHWLCSWLCMHVSAPSARVTRSSPCVRASG